MKKIGKIINHFIKSTCDIDINQLNEDIKNKELEIKKLEVASETKLKEIKKLEETAETRLKEIKKLKKNTEEEFEIIKNKDHEIKSLKDSIERQKQSYEKKSKIEKLQMNSLLKRDQISNKIQTQELQTTNDSLKASLLQKESDIKNISSTFNEKLKTVQKKLSQTHNELELSKNNLETAKSKTKEINQTIDFYKTSTDELKVEKEDLLQKIEEAKKDNNNQKSLIEILNDKIQKNEEESKFIKNSVKEYQQQLTQTKNELEQSKSELDNYKAKSKEQNELIETYKSTISELRNKNREESEEVGSNEKESLPINKNSNIEFHIEQEIQGNKDKTNSPELEEKENDTIKDSQETLNKEKDFAEAREEEPESQNENNSADEEDSNETETDENKEDPVKTESQNENNSADEEDTNETETDEDKENHVETESQNEDNSTDEEDTNETGSAENKENPAETEIRNEDNSADEDDTNETETDEDKGNHVETESQNKDNSADEDDTNETKTDEDKGNHVETESQNKDNSADEDDTNETKTDENDENHIETVSQNNSNPVSGIEINEQDSETSTKEYSEEERTFFKKRIYLNDSLIEAQKLSIPEVYDVKEKKMIIAKEFFQRDENELILWRRTLQEAIAIGEKRFICPKCKDAIKICGIKTIKGKVCFFAHVKNSENNDCPYKLSYTPSIERNGYGSFKESALHRDLKKKIYEALTAPKSIEKGITDVECNKHISSDFSYLNWRKPDVYAEWKGRKFVFELLLSTTFVGIIVDRDIFYRLKNYEVIWVFNFENEQENTNLRNLMCKDIYYANKRNVFFFDNEAIIKSQKAGELILRCRWLDKDESWGKNHFVSMEELKFDEEHHKPYFFDADQEYLEQNPEQVEQRKKIENTREYLLEGLIKKQKRIEEERLRRQQNKTSLQEKLLSEDKSVYRFKEKGKYGYAYDKKIVIDPIYSSAEEIREDGYAQVGFNRKIGLVRKDGKEIVPVEYKTIEIINDVLGIILAYNKRVDLWIFETHIPLCEEFNDKKQEIIKEKSYELTKYRLKTKKCDYNGGYDLKDLFDLRIMNTCVIVFSKDKSYIVQQNNVCILNEFFKGVTQINNTNLFIAKDQETNLYGIVNSENKEIINISYTSIKPTKSIYITFKTSQEDNKMGIMDYYGNIYCKPIHKELYYLEQDLFAFKDDDKWGICDSLGQTICKEKFTYLKDCDGILKGSTSIFYKNQQVSNFSDNDKLCEIDTNGEIKHSEINYEKQNFKILKSGDLYAIYTPQDEELFGFEFTSIDIINKEKGVAILQYINGKYTILYNNQITSEEGYDQITILVDDRLSYSRNKYISIGSYEGPISDFEYNSLKVIDKNHFIAESTERFNYSNSQKYYYLINSNGENIIDTKFDQIDNFEDNIASAIIDGCKGKIDINGIKQEEEISLKGNERNKLFKCFERYYFKNENNEIISKQYGSVEPIDRYYFKVKLPSEKGFSLLNLLDHTETENLYKEIKLLKNDIFDLINIKDIHYIYNGTRPLYVDGFEDLQPLTKNLIGLKQTDWGVGNILSGKIIIPLIYSSVEIEEDKIAVTKAEYEGKYTIDGIKIFETLSSNIDIPNYHVVKFLDNYGLRNSEEEDIIECIYQNIYILSDKYIKVQKGKLWALYKISGEALTEFKYTKISNNEKTLFASRENKYGALDENGEEQPLFKPTEGGFIKIFFGIFNITDSNKQNLLPDNYEGIEDLGNGYYSVRLNGLYALAKRERIITQFSYSKIKYIDWGYFALLNKFEQKRRIFHEGKKYNGSTYTHYTTKIIPMQKWGIIDSEGNVLQPCKYKSIGEFNSDGNIEIYSFIEGKKTFNIIDLEKMKVPVEMLVPKQKYETIVDEFVLNNRYESTINESEFEQKLETKEADYLCFGITIKIENKSFLIPKQYLYKKIHEYTKGEAITVQYNGCNKAGYPIWITSDPEKEKEEDNNEEKLGTPNN